MQQVRKKLTLKVASNDSDLPADAEAPAAGPARLIDLAIGRKLCISLTYNRVGMTMAPHILYTRHGDLFVDGVVIEKGGVPPKELKLGSFKLIGLSAVTLTAIPFAPSALFDRAAERYEGTTEKVVEA